ncbi:uncharacterized protein LOC107814577 isoform X3 [Nicotiana tabacum]|uniref:Uncharacterized protein LOC107814577 isoform X3 n=1 Tax=Nicotiana tabacum TaxID=4097 RepID=A0AC58U7X2_TOBAC
MLHEKALDCTLSIHMQNRQRKKLCRRASDGFLRSAVVVFYFCYSVALEPEGKFSNLLSFIFSGSNRRVILIIYYCLSQYAFRLQLRVKNSEPKDQLDFD